MWREILIRAACAENAPVFAYRLETVPPRMSVEVYDCVMLRHPNILSSTFGTPWLLLGVLLQQVRI
jgi:hypothetical protein